MNSFDELSKVTRPHRAYDPETALNEHRLTFYLPVETEPLYAYDCDGAHEVEQPQGDEPLYMKRQEVHEQRAWTLTEIREAAGEAGMVFVRAVDAATGIEPDGESTRIFCVLREQGKKAPADAGGEKEGIE